MRIWFFLLLLISDMLQILCIYWRKCSVVFVVGPLWDAAKLEKQKEAYPSGLEWSAAGPSFVPIPIESPTPAANAWSAGLIGASSSSVTLPIAEEAIYAVPAQQQPSGELILVYRTM